MPSPFPGVDPYLEAPGLWPGFSYRFMTYMSEALQPLLPPGYYADIRTREEIGIAGYHAEHVLVPDLGVKELEASGAERPVSASGAERPVSSAGALAKDAAVPEVLVIPLDEKLKVNYLEIRDATSGDRLVTLIELLGPSNKLPGPDREAFERKRDEVLASDANWVEIDFLRQGARMARYPAVDAHCRSRGHAYSIVTSRALRRSPRLELEILGFTIRDRLPVVSLPLRDPEPDVALDLASVGCRAYDTGPYTRIVRYERPPSVPLTADERAWVVSTLEARGVALDETCWEA